jgi:hypothetical protein
LTTIVGIVELPDVSSITDSNHPIESASITEYPRLNFNTYVLLFYEDFFNSFGLQCYLIDGEHEFSEETSVEGVDGRLDHFDQILGGAEIIQTKKLVYLGPMTD